MKIEFNLVVILGSRELDSVVLNTERDTVIGSADKADITLQGDRIRGEHAALSFDGDKNQWSIDAKEGDVRIRGELIESDIVTLNRPISIGPYLIRLEIKQEQEEQNFLVGTEPDASLNKRDALPSKVLAWLSLLSSRAKSIKRGGLIGILALAVLFVGILKFSGSDEGGVDTAEESVNYTVDQKREIKRYTQWVNELWQQEDSATALSVSSTAFTNNPKVAELSELYIEAIEKEVDSLSEKGEYEKAQKIALTANEGLEENEVVQGLITRLEADLKLKKKHLAQYDLSKKRFDLMMGQSESAFDAGDINKAKKLLTSIDPLVTKFEPEWKDRKDKLLVKVDGVLKEQNIALEEQRRERLTRVRAASEQFKECVNLYKSGDSPAAYSECRAASKGAQGSQLQKEIAMWLELLEPTFNKEVVTLTAKAEDCYKNGWIACAFHNWQRVIDIDSRNTDVVRRLQRAKAKQLEIAKTKFREARAYNDVGRSQRAAKILQELKLIYPISESDIHIKADKMLNRLVASKT